MEISIGNKIRELRKKKKLTQLELAEMCNLSRSYLADLERDRYNPSLETLKIIAENLDATVSDLLGDKNNVILTEKDEKDIAKEIEKLKEKLKLSEGLMFDGEPASEEAIQSVLDAMSFGIRQAKIINKKYAPKKYLDGGDADDKNQD